MEVDKPSGRHGRTMYLFCSNADVSFETGSPCEYAKPFGEVTRFQFLGGCLIWVETPMSRLIQMYTLAFGRSGNNWGSGHEWDTFQER